jgi:uncharacterized protein YjbI with pentapeptide repeats
MKQLSRSALAASMVPGATISQVALEPKLMWPSSRVRNVAFSNVDFHSAMIGGFWRRPRFETCEFTACDLDGVDIRHTQFRGCAFVNVSCGRLYTFFRNCAFTDVTVTSCVFAGLHATGTVFRNCTFERTLFKDTHFNKCRFEACEWSGELDGVALVDSVLVLSVLSGLKAKDCVAIGGSIENAEVPEGFRYL